MVKFELKKAIGAAVFLALFNIANAADLPDFSSLVEDYGATVVNITGERVAGGDSNASPVPENDPFYDWYRRFGPQEPRGQQSVSRGSGFVLGQDGLILTNAHVVANTTKIVVKLIDKREYSAKVIGFDKRTDIAVIKIEASDLAAVKIGNPEKLKVGEWVLAIGSPFGFENSVTAGIVSAKGRSLPQENYVPFIQTDVAINPGNSGGPLFNLSGEVVGINSQIYSRTGGFMGLSFAIPIDVAVNVAEQLRTKGRVSRGKIGVVIQQVTKDLAESFGLDKPTGALVNSVTGGGPADLAGIETSDVILKFDGKNVESVGDLPRIVAQTKPGKKVIVDVWRKGEVRQLDLTVGEMEDTQASRSSSESQQPKSGTANLLPRLGLELAPLSSSQQKEFGITGGLLVLRVEGASANSGIREGDIVLALNNHDIKTIEQLKGLMKKYQKSRSVALLVKRGEGSIYVPIRLN